MFAGMMLVGMAIEGALGWPAGLHRLIGHPVSWLGRLIAGLDARLNRPDRSPAQRRARGLFTALAVILVATLVGLVLQSALPGGISGQLIGGLLAFPLIATRSLYDHVDAVARPLNAGDLTGARRAVAQIVGRDPNALDEGGVVRAAVESLAENTSDGVIAPLFWGALLGLPGLCAYKAINTLDSMIAHRTPRHEDFGRAAAHIDDWANLVPARLSAALFALASGRPRASWAVVRADARRHRSPNAGWPEAATAGALGIRISGPRAYNGRMSQEPWVNAPGRNARAADLRAALGLYLRAMLLTALLLGFLHVL
ncbi:adenosylcobinamide-phosphate synthase CbiB [Frigidibacter sp. MR17.14]|uniref:adenosylcobinamide-phosphate synthase CbiB n=1 Tax=Frigidibacter sp. MR17.14 TaxID=3126509 RepID=UPI003012F9B1